MSLRWDSVSDEWGTPVSAYLIGCLTITAGIFFFLYWLLTPAVVVNPGLKAYVPPPATRLVSAPRKMDAPELAELGPVSSLHALAQDYQANAAVESSPKAEVQRPVRKRERAPVRREEGRQPPAGYAAQWQWNGGWNRDNYRQYEQRQYDYRAYGYRQQDYRQQYDYRRYDTQRQVDRRGWW